MRMVSQQWKIASLVTGAAALLTLLMAVATTNWLHMMEECKKPFVMNENLTIVLNITSHSSAGLWKICTVIDDNPVTCIDVGLSEGIASEREEDQWRTGAVAEATRIQFPLTFSAVLFTLAGFVCSIFGNFRLDKRTIIAAVMYISSGLCLSVSVILYISRINEQLTLQESKFCNKFHYRYGWSFYLVGVSFVLEETSAVIAIKLFLLRNFNKLDDMVRIIPGLEEKLFVETTRLQSIDSQSQTMIW